ncbi:MAG TPA: TonB-dependent receptor [Steroidobacteraceae bacterium]
MSVLAYAHVALAQSDAGTGAPSDARTGVQLEEITVTARRREEPLQTVPIAITAFNQEALDDKRIQSATDLQYYVPSFNVSGQFNRNQEFFTIRGQGETGLNISSAPGGGPAVVTYLAEVPLVAGGGSGLYYDLQDVQVLKGPQGTLFGRNTTGGAVLFEPRRPVDRFEGYGQLTAGDYGDSEFEGALNLPLVPERLLVRLSMQRIGRDGFTRDVGPDFPDRRYDNSDSWAGRFSLLWQPNEVLEDYFIADALDSKDNGPGTVVLGVNPQSLAAQAFPVLLSQAQAQQQRGPRAVSLDTRQFDVLKHLSLINHTTVQLTDNTRLKNILSYTRRQLADASDRDGMPSPVLDAIGPAPGRWHENWQTITEELQLQGKAFDRLDWQAGGYFEDSLDFDANFNQREFFDLFNNYLARADIQSRSRALYGQGTYDLSSVTPGLKLTGGYRYTWDTLATAIGLGTAEGAPASLVLAGAAPHSGYSSVLGLDYLITPTTLAYVTSRRGYKSGGFNLLSQGPASPFFSYKPENDIDAEVGLKTSGNLGGMSGRLNIDAFYTWYNDAQVAVSEVIEGQAQSVTQNAAKARIKGVEVDGALLPGAGFELTLAYSYNEGKYTQYFSPVSGNLTGTPISYMPKHKVNAGASWNWPVGPGLGAVVISANYAWQSEYFAAFALGDPFGFIPGYSLVNARVEWKNALLDHLDVGVFVTNATDRLYRATNIPLYTSPFGFSASTYGPPRMFGASIRYAF